MIALRAVPCRALPVQRIQSDERAGWRPRASDPAAAGGARGRARSDRRIRGDPRPCRHQSSRCALPHDARPSVVGRSARRPRAREATEDPVVEPDRPYSALAVRDPVSVATRRRRIERSRGSGTHASAATELNTLLRLTGPWRRRPYVASTHLTTAVHANVGALLTLFSSLFEHRIVVIRITTYSGEIGLR